MPNSLREGVARYFTPGQIDILRNTTIGIAGAGGLGSNIAMLLARCGAERFVIIDRDHLEKSNLNRQHYWPDQLGQPKVDAIAHHLHALNPHIDLQIHHAELDRRSIPLFLPLAQLWLEALDEPHSKKLFVEQALSANLPVIAASGIAGFGGPPPQIRKLGLLTVAGDFETDISNAPPLAPRVSWVAAMMADAALERLLGAHSS